MDFFARQERSRRTSALLVALFAAAFLAVAGATTLLVAVFLRAHLHTDFWLGGNESFGQWAAAHASLLGLVAAGTLAVLGIASLYRSATLARGGAQVARMLGATEVTGESGDPLHRRLLNVVEEMAIASGLPVPDVFVLEQEPAINAFASGLTHADAAVTVTRGALERLTRDELQGVVAHEFSHIVNGDMRLNQQLIGMSYGILVLSLAGRWLLRSARHGRRGRNTGGTLATVVLGLGLTVIGSIGLLLARLIKAAVSREREALADAAAVQYTRHPSGLAGALKKIGGYTARLSSVDGEEVAHMLFAGGARGWLGRWLATHPPLEERIRALDPSFDPRDFAKLGDTLGAATPTVAAEPTSGAVALAPSALHDPEALLERAGAVEDAAVGDALRAALPEELYHAAHGQESCWLLALALALSPREDTRARQLALLERQIGAARCGRVRSLGAEAAGLQPELRLPLVEIAIPALKRRPAEHVRYLLELLDRLGELDDERRLFDYALLRMLRHYLRGAAEGAPSRMAAPQAVAALLANVARFGHADAEAARHAYAAGLETLAGAKAAARLPRVPQEGDLTALDRALDALGALAPRAKRRVLAAVLATIRHDRRIALEELELFRVIAATLDCPVPPALAPAAPGARH